MELKRALSAHLLEKARGQGIGLPLAKIDTVFENDFI